MANMISWIHANHRLFPFITFERDGILDRKTSINRYSNQINTGISVISETHTNTQKYLTICTVDRYMFSDLRSHKMKMTRDTMNNIASISDQIINLVHSQVAISATKTDPERSTTENPITRRAGAPTLANMELYNFFHSR
jgi:hypothetical protein